MFNNTVKKVVATGLLFSLCAPCCFASAQSFGGNGMNIPMGSPANQQNRAVDEDFLRRVLNIRIPAELLNQQPQRQLTALEQLWEQFDGPSSFMVEERLFETASGFAEAVRGRYSLDPENFAQVFLTQILLNAMINGQPVADSVSMVESAIAEIFTLKPMAAKNIAKAALLELIINPRLRKAFTKALQKAFGENFEQAMAQLFAQLN